MYWVPLGNLITCHCHCTPCTTVLYSALLYHTVLSSFTNYLCASQAYHPLSSTISTLMYNCNAQPRDPASALLLNVATMFCIHECGDQGNYPRHSEKSFDCFFRIPCNYQLMSFEFLGSDDSIIKVLPMETGGTLIEVNVQLTSLSAVYP